jgi:hypothetical protein
MKRLSPTRILCALGLAPYFSVLLLTNPLFSLLPLRSRQHYLSLPTALPHRLPCALHYGTVWAHLNAAPSHH